MTVSSGQQTQLEKAVTAAIYFVELQFASGTQYLSTANFSIPWGGHDWLGLGVLGGISQVEESDSLESKALNLTLTAADPSWLALSVGPVEEWRRKPAKMYMCPLNANFQLIDTPVQCWSGEMSQLSLTLSAAGEGQIVMRCKTSIGGLKRRTPLRMNAVQQKLEFPDDTGFDGLNNLIAHSEIWVSKRFQQI